MKPGTDRTDRHPGVAGDFDQAEPPEVVQHAHGALARRQQADGVTQDAGFFGGGEEIEG